MIARLFWAFAKVGALGFGGGYAMVPLFEHELVARQAWLSHSQFADLVVLSQVTPGPISTSAGTIVGYRQAGVWGAVVATAGVILPSLLIVWLLARAVGRHRQLGWLRAVLAGLRPVVVALVAVAALTLARRSVPDWRAALVAVATGVAVGYFRLHPVAAILGAGVVGIMFFG